jgi:hypothetical protein
MRFLKNFESFHDTGVDDGIGEVQPEYNPVLKQTIKEFVDDFCGRGGYVELAKKIGMKLPSNIPSDKMDQIESELKSNAMEFFNRNPEQLPNEVGFKTYKVSGGDGITRTNKVGGTIPT